MVDGQLAEGSRIHVVVPPAAVDHPIVAIRRFTQAITSLDQLAQPGSATPAQVEQLSRAVADRQTILVSGGTGSGKTTLLNLLGGLITTEERVVTIEDAAELRIPGHRVRLEAHPANSEGVGDHDSPTAAIGSSSSARPHHRRRSSGQGGDGSHLGAQHGPPRLVFDRPCLSMPIHPRRHCGDWRPLPSRPATLPRWRCGDSSWPPSS